MAWRVLLLTVSLNWDALRVISPTSWSLCVVMLTQAKIPMASSDAEPTALISLTLRRFHLMAALRWSSPRSGGPRRSDGRRRGHQEAMASMLAGEGASRAREPGSHPPRAGERLELVDLLDEAVPPQ